MATPVERRLVPTYSRRFGTGRDAQITPDLTKIQTKSYAAFLQSEAAPLGRRDHGMEGVLREIFPIESYDKQVKLEYIKYELGKPRYSPDECRQLRLTYGRPFRVWLRLVKDEAIEEEVYLGDLPIMLGGGEFIINGAERVVVSQLHRSPGVDFVLDTDGTSDRKLASCRVIPERGSWIEINATKKDALTVRIDQSGKFSAMTLIRAMDSRFGTDADILRLFYDTSVEKVVDGRSVVKIENKIAVDDVVYPTSSDRAGEILVEAGQRIGKNVAETICTSGVKKLEVMELPKVPLIFNSLVDDVTSSHEEALLRIYQRWRPGNPPQLEKARTLFAEKFYDVNRYRLGHVGRFRINRKLDLGVSEKEMTLRPEDLIAAIQYLLGLAAGEDWAEVDDIDHLGNRRLRTIDELASDELRKGFLKLRRTVQERMSLKDQEDMTPRSLINPKSISAAIEYFFGRGELSQVVDQTNPLAQLTHERRLSALGPGGLNRKRAGFEVRDVHISHYGRICPIETPEGTNIGLISSLAIYAGVDSYGFLVTPYRVVQKGKLTSEVAWLRADEESEAYVAPADTTLEDDRITESALVARHRSDFEMVSPDSIEYIDVAPSQMVGVSAGLIRFLEHDDANRALMGSNMQRQAVPLLQARSPFVGTGMEHITARDSGAVVSARRTGTVDYVDSQRVVVRVEGESGEMSREMGADIYSMTKFRRSNQNTCINQKPIVRVGDRVAKGQVLADGPCTELGELALGRNVLVAFMPWRGYNFEDAILVSERMVKEDYYTSIHIEEFETESRDTKLGPEEITRDIPNVSEGFLKDLDDSGIIRIGAYVKPGDILIGKVTPKGETQLTPEEKLLRAIFGEKAGDVRDASLLCPPGIDGIIVGVKIFSRKGIEKDDRAKAIEAEELDMMEKNLEDEIRILHEEVKKRVSVKLDGQVLGADLFDDDGREKLATKGTALSAELLHELPYSAIMRTRISGRSRELEQELRHLEERTERQVEVIRQMFEEKKEKIRRGDELPPGVIKLVKVFWGLVADYSLDVYLDRVSTDANPTDGLARSSARGRGPGMGHRTSSIPRGTEQGQEQGLRNREPRPSGVGKTAWSPRADLNERKAEEGSEPGPASTTASILKVKAEPLYKIQTETN